MYKVENDKQPGFDNVDGKLIRMIAKYIAEPVRHIFNLIVKEIIFPQAWKVAEIIPVSKNCRSTCSRVNSRNIRILPTLSKLMR